MRKVRQRPYVAPEKIIQISVVPTNGWDKIYALTSSGKILMGSEMSYGIVLSEPKIFTHEEYHEEMAKEASFNFIPTGDCSGT